MSDPTVQLQLMRDIGVERQKQDEKWGEQNHTGVVFATILGEEYGEVCKAVLDEPEENLIKELIQVAAVAVAWLEAIERHHGKEKESSVRV